MNLKDLISILVDANNKIEKEGATEDAVKGQEDSVVTDPKKDEVPQPDARDIKIKELESVIESLNGTIASKDTIIEQNTEQIKALKEMAVVDNPPMENLSLEELIQKGEF